jgi:ribonuclease P protein subunit RPR2
MKDKGKLRRIASENIITLFEEARLCSKDKPYLSDRYVKLARKIAMKVNLRMPLKYKRRFCNHCYSYFTNKNFRVRVHKSRVIYYCLNCKKYTRFVIKKVKSKKI